MAQSSKLKTQKGRLIIFSAPSGAGKTTIVRHLLSCGLNLEFSVSATSRAPRQNEIQARDYYFISEKEFREKIEKDEFLEWEEVYPGTFYGTLKNDVERIRESGKNVIFDLDVVGGLDIKKLYGDDALAVFIQTPSINELKTRLKNRSTETDDKIDIRVAKAVQEMKFAKQFDVILVNDDLSETFEKAEKLVKEFLK
jgi:guanylate kinase